MVKWCGQRVDAPGHVTTEAPVMSPKLTAIDFKAVAAKGAYVYCYLRSSNFTPYYVGVATRHDRPTSKSHSINVPAEKTLIRVLQLGLTRDDAIKWEIFYIAHYGRIDNGTGILRNLTNGGEGVTGKVWTQAQKKAKSVAMTGKHPSAKTLLKKLY